MFRVGKSKLKAIAVAATLAAPTVTMAQAITATWTSTVTGGTFNLGSNWNHISGSFVQAGGLATFPAASASVNPFVVTLATSGSVTIGGLQFTGDFLTTPRGYNLTGPAASVLTLSSNSTIDISGGSQTISATTVGAGNVIKSGVGTLVLTGANTFNTGISVTGGKLIATGANTLRGNNVLSTSGGAVLELGTVGLMNGMVLSLGTSGATPVLTVTGGTTNGTTGNSFLVQSGTINVASGASFSINGSLNDSDQTGLNGFTKAGAGTLTIGTMALNGTTVTSLVVRDTGQLSLNNLYAPTFSVNGGTLAFLGGGTVAAGLLAPGTGSGTVNGGALTVSAQTTYNANTTLTSGAITFNTSTITGNTTLNAGSLLSNVGTIVGNVTANNGATAAFNGGLLTGTLSVAGSTANVSLNTGTVNGLITIVNGQYTSNGGVLVGTLATSGGSSTLNAGTVTGAVNHTGGTLTLAGTRIVGNTAISTGTAIINGSLHTGDINMNSGTLLFTGGASVSGNLFVNGGTTKVALQGTPNAAAGKVTVGGLTIAGGQKMDLTNNKLVVHYGANPTPASTLRGYLVSAVDGGLWDQAGIDSSFLSGNATLTLGSADGADGVVAGLASGDYVIQSARYGDINLDGNVNTTDFNILSTHFGGAGVWTSGDLNYDGNVNTTDFNLLSTNFGQSAGFSAADLSMLVDFADAHGITMAPVPEPGAISLLIMASAAAYGRRRRPINKI